MKPKGIFLAIFNIGTNQSSHAEFFFFFIWFLSCLLFFGTPFIRNWVWSRWNLTARAVYIRNICLFFISLFSWLPPPSFIGHFSKPFHILFFFFYLLDFTSLVFCLRPNSSECCSISGSVSPQSFESGSLVQSRSAGGIDSMRSTRTRIAFYLSHTLIFAQCL